MRSDYVKPSIEFEEFETNTAIATGCTEVVNLGPGDLYHDTCSYYEDKFQSFFGAAPMVEPVPANFYEGTVDKPSSCSCYLSAGDSLVFTS